MRLRRSSRSGGTPGSQSLATLNIPLTATHEQIAREYGGGDWEENVEQLKREKEELRDAGGQSQNNLAATPEPGEWKEDEESAEE